MPAAGRGGWIPSDFETIEGRISEDRTERAARSHPFVCPDGATFT